LVKTLNKPPPGTSTRQILWTSVKGRARST
jgi:hypothetical protein